MQIKILFSKRIAHFINYVFINNKKGNDNFLSDSSHPQEPTPPKVFSSPTNRPKSSRNGLSRFHRPKTAYGSTKNVLPNKMSMTSVQKKNGDNALLSSSEKVLWKLNLTNLV